MNFLLADDHEVVRRGLRQMLAEDFPDASFGEARTGPQTLEMAQAENWDLLVLDINLPGRGGLDVLSDLKTSKPELRILVLSMLPEEEYALRAIRRGAAGYLSKQTVATELIGAVRQVLAGRRYFSDQVAEQLASGVGGGGERHHQLSDRELQVMRMLATGKSVKEVAAELFLSEKTVFTYRDRLRVKLAVKSDVELARYALRHQLVQ